jgi:hypothetical protein
MNTRVQIVRLVTATLGSTAICLFVIAYCSLSLALFKHEHPGHVITNGAQFALKWKWYSLAFPLIIAAVGFGLIARPLKQPVLLELLIGFTWLLSLTSVGFCVLSWIGANDVAYVN